MLDRIGIADGKLHNFGDFSDRDILFEMEIDKEPIPRRQILDGIAQQSLVLCPFHVFQYVRILRSQGEDVVKRYTCLLSGQPVKALFSYMVQDDAHRHHVDPCGQTASVRSPILPEFLLLVFKKLNKNDAMKIVDIEPTERHMFSHEGMSNRMVDQTRKSANKDFPGLSVPGKIPGKEETVFIMGGFHSVMTLSRRSGALGLLMESSAFDIRDDTCTIRA